MNTPTSRFGLHRVSCRFCDSSNIIRAGVSEVCECCGRVLSNSPVKVTRDGATIYLRKGSNSFKQFCEDNWITWTDCRNVDGYVWFKEERDVWNSLASLGLQVSFSEYSPHFRGPAWQLAVDGPLDNILARRNEKVHLKDMVIYPSHLRASDIASEAFSTNAIPSA